jgi:hypothetical protein
MGEEGFDNYSVTGFQGALSTTTLNNERRGRGRGEVGGDMPLQS